jgi:hypothetical protein
MSFLDSISDHTGAENGYILQNVILNLRSMVLQEYSEINLHISLGNLAKSIWWFGLFCVVYFTFTHFLIYTLEDL